MRLQEQKNLVCDAMDCMTKDQLDYFVALASSYRVAPRAQKPKLRIVNSFDGGGVASALQGDGDSFPDTFPLRRIQ